jgi:hypothetical protein
MEEAAFQSWIKELPWWKEFTAEYGEEPDLNAGDYDYRAAWKAGVKPERDEYDGGRYHWPSSAVNSPMLKAFDHPTAWKEDYMQATGVNPDSSNQPQSIDPGSIEWLREQMYRRYGGSFR